MDDYPDEPIVVPYYHHTEAERGVIVLAADPEAFTDLDRYVAGFAGIGLSVVILIGDHDSVRPLLAGQTPTAAGALSAPVVYRWVEEHLPDVVEVIFLP